MQPKPQFKPINFENPVFKTLLARKVNVQEKHLKYFVLPVEGDKITLGNIIYRITYIRQSPFRFTAEPCAILSDGGKWRDQSEKGVEESSSQASSPVTKEK